MYLLFVLKDNQIVYQENKKVTKKTTLKNIQLSPNLVESIAIDNETSSYISDFKRNTIIDKQLVD